MLKHHERMNVPMAAVRGGAPRDETMPRTPPSIALSIPDAVVASGLSRSFLYRAMTRGDLAFIKKGRRRLIPTAALSEYLLHSDDAD